jgi:hypothetical protein
MMQAAAIPYRTEPALAEGQWLVIMLVTVLLLAALYAGLLYARRKGWLDRWMLDSGSRTGKSDRTLCSKAAGRWSSSSPAHRLR